MRKLFGQIVLLPFFALLVYILGKGYAVGESEWKEITASSSPFVYSDELLMGNEFQLDPDIAKVSVALSSDVYAESTVRASLSQMGFENIETYGSYAIPRTVEDNDYVAYAIAHKTYKDYIIYVVPIRGTPKNNEWISDFTPGNREDGYHEGFYKASEHVYDSLLDAFSKDGYANNKRIILLTGHSRGAAVANIIAEKLISSRYGKIFAYTFACPAVRKGELAQYKNILNFNIENDVVPCIPLKDWGFGRYGTDVKSNMSIWSNKAHLSVPELNSTLKTLQKFVPDIETCNTKECKLAFGIVAWAMAGANEYDLPKILARASVDSDESLISSIENFNFFKEEYNDLVNDINTMYDFYDQIAMDLNDMTEEEFEKMRWENPEVFALYDTFAITAVTSAKALEELRPKVKIARQALITGYKAKDIIMLFLTPERNVMDEIANAHLCEEYVKWINHDYFGYYGKKNREFNGNIDFSTVKTIGPYCFVGSTGEYTVEFTNQYVGQYAFYDNNGLTEVIINNDVIRVGDYAFSKNSAIKSLVYPCDYTSFGEGCFESSTLEKITYTVGKTGVMIDRIWQPFLGNWYFDMIEYDVCGSLKEVIIEEGITHIADNLCRSCTALEKVTIPSTVTSIGDYSFYECTSLRDYCLPDGLTRIGDYAFYKCISSAEWALPKNIVSIGERAFTGNTGIASVVIPGSIESVLSYTFNNCTGITELTLPADFMDYEYCFAGCSSVEKITYTVGKTGVMCDRYHPNNELPWPEYQVSSSLKEIIFEKGITHIADKLYYLTNTHGLKSISLPSTVQSIGDYSFNGCSCSEPIILPENLISVGEAAFGDGCAFAENLVLPDSLVSIGDFAFVGNKEINSLSIPNSIQTIGYRAFAGCTNIIELILPVEFVGYDSSFEECTAVEKIIYKVATTGVMDRTGISYTYMPEYSAAKTLKEIVFPDGLKSIYGTELMRYSFALEKVVLLSRDTIIEPYTFIKEVDIYGYLGSTAQAYAEQYGNLFIPLDGCLDGGLHCIVVKPGIDAGCETDGMTDHKYCSVCEEVFAAPEVISALGHKQGEWSVVIEATSEQEGLAEIYCTRCDVKLAEEILPPVVPGFEIDTDGWIRGYNGEATEIVIPMFVDGIKVKGIDSDAFDYRMDIISVVIPEGVRSIESRTFEGCSNLVSVELPESVTSIGEGAFWGCERLRSIVIPDGVTFIERNAFAYCHGLISVKLSSNLNSIGDNAFEECIGLTEVNIPDSVTTIGEEAFINCFSLNRVKIPTSVTGIGEWAFALTDDDFTAEVECESYAHYWCMASGVRLDVIHNIENVTEGAVAPTCTLTGLTEGGLCEKCGEYIEQSMVPALGHDGEWITVKPAACTENGEEKLEECIRCGEASSRMIPALRHPETILKGDETHHWDACALCDYVMNRDEHSRACNDEICTECSLPYSGENISYHAENAWVSDDTGHAQSCMNCGYVSKKEKHERFCMDDYCVICDGFYAGGNVIHLGPLHQEGDEIMHWEACECGDIVGGRSQHWRYCDETVCIECALPYNGGLIQHKKVIMVQNEEECWPACLTCEYTGTKNAHRRMCNEKECFDCGVPYVGDNILHRSVTVSDENYHWRVCSMCDIIIEQISAHYRYCFEEICYDCQASYSGNNINHSIEIGDMIADETAHWGDCSWCGSAMEREEHLRYCNYGLCVYCDYSYTGNNVMHVMKKYNNGHVVGCSCCDYESDETDHWRYCNEDVCGEETCGAAYKGDNVRHGKEEVIPAIPATHATTGLTEGISCERCGEILAAQTEIPVVDVIKTHLPASMTVVKKHSFTNTAVECVIIPAGCTEIETNAFSNNAHLRFVEIPATVGRIDDAAFENCPSDLIIVTTDGSSAHSYAQENGIAFVLMGK